MGNDTLNKERWVGLFREIGLDDDTMLEWHRLFESHYPDGHQSFMEWLGIPTDEITAIRAKSAAG
ncbi:MAG: hypothetical protein GWM87_05915 [Xanthomonadales bacterium]|nr:hypothetical protein [Xanthomonadales bacterium]NIX12514.1 hypothetical protein [Xanthomonadales bacterium]